MPAITYGGPGVVVTPGIQNTGIIGVNGANATAPSWSTKRYFGDVGKYLDPTETPFSSSVKTGKPVDIRKLEWASTFLAPTTSAIGATAIPAGGVAYDVKSFVVETGGSVKFMVSELFKIDSELFWCTALNHTTNTVSAMVGMGGTTVATHLAAAPIQLLGPAALENVNSPRAPIAKGANEFNYPRLFDYSIQLSERENNTSDFEFGSGSKYDKQLAKIMKEAAIDFEKASLTGVRSEEVDMSPAATATPTMMGGLDYFTSKSMSMSTTAITENALMDAMQRLWTDVGEDNMAKDLLVGPFVRRALSSLWNTDRIASVKDKETTLVWKTIETDFGTVRFVLSRYIPAGTAYLVNLEDISIHPYKNQQWKEERLPASGPFIIGRYTGDYTMMFKNNAARLKITNISEVQSDYPNM